MFHLAGEEGLTIALGAGWGEEYCDEAIANADFIVKACNNFDELLEALRLYLRIDDDRRAGCEISPNDWAVAHQSARAAMSKATGE